MKSMTHFLAPAALIILFAAHSNVQSQTSPKTDSGAQASTPKVAAPAATPREKTEASPSSATANAASPSTTTADASATAPPSRKSTLARRSRKIPPSPPLTSIRHARTTKKGNPGSTANIATDLDSAGRIDNAGKHVGFYPPTRGTATGKSQASAAKQGHRSGAKKAQ
jgi:hypothetical protein